MEIIWTPPALRDLRRIHRQSAERIRGAVRRYAATQHGDVRKLEGEKDRYRLRVGEHRVIFRHELGRLVIVVLRVGRRRDIYRTRSFSRSGGVVEHGANVIVGDLRVVRSKILTAPSRS